MSASFAINHLGEHSVEIGMPVEMVTRKLREDGSQCGILVYGYKALAEGSPRRG